ncbi:MAG: 2-oxo-4-hydroxy-4-carboxy-5-ureidoimidazoline decarboxylase [Proteobacteria bacterium]|nr:2-oxo-4-hydroxy-4-carboxy-5-ureidoimidazoline decarboxylase [Pseudomonadota bacterium]
MQTSIDQINAMERDAFVKAFGGIFEHSPWVAERAWQARPFADMGAVHDAMKSVVRALPRKEQVALLRVHPDLAGREAEEGTMTDHSVSEQASAGLDALTREEMAHMRDLNQRYRVTHGFPFIIAVRRYTKDQIFSEFERRLANDSDAELEECLAQIFVITRLRLMALAGEMAVA